ncbi:hypothetical protein AVL59_28390 [Streptomyces griseochromogenes]|uniref:Uncharacterized protein n=1 Tax=Streptomyces griseochromogenes TaxID=68214 RepID=A0A1B1B2G4_9ACTN|nr:hypothetical protein AVL59_28390 [Streptomyces griseochromogenes]
MFPVSTRGGVAAGAAALLLAAAGPAPAVAADVARARTAAVISCAGAIVVNVHPLNGAVDGRSGTNFRCATPDRSFAAELTISGSLRSGGELSYEARTTDSLRLTDTGEVFRFTVDRRFDRDTTAATGNAAERGSSSQARDSGTGTFGTGTGLVTFLVTNGYTLDVSG